MQLDEEIIQDMFGLGDLDVSNLFDTLDDYRRRNASPAWIDTVERLLGHLAMMQAQLKS